MRRSKVLSLVPLYPKACSAISIAQKLGYTGSKAKKGFARIRRAMARNLLYEDTLACFALKTQQSTVDLARQMGLEVKDNMLVYYSRLEEGLDLDQYFESLPEIEPG